MRATEILRDREDATRGEIEADKFLARLFDDGPSGVAETAGNQAVLAGANAALPIMERNLKLDFDASIAELGSFLRALDVCERARLLGCEGYSLHAGEPLPVCSLPDGNTDQDVCDMAGNAAEWTADWWEKRVPSGKNRLGVTPSLSRVPRGDMLVGDRSPCPGSRIGFRIALPVLTPTRD